MFGKRSDGRVIKTLAPEFKLMPSLMSERSDAHVYFNQDVKIDAINEYIAKKQEEGIKFSIMEVIIAAIVRIIATRPQLNRFVMKGRTYARNHICISLTIKKSMTDDAEETTVKFYFDGTENIFEIKEKIAKLLVENKKEEKNNGTDKTARMLTMVPTPIIRGAVGLIKWLDKHNHLPKGLIKVSPFHTSCYVTNVGSLGIDSIYHHLYNFGTTSMFFAIGKKKKSYMYEDDEIKQERVINLAFVGDERICDGHYYAMSFRTLNRLLSHPELLESNLTEIVQDIK